MKQINGRGGLVTEVEGMWLLRKNSTTNPFITKKHMSSKEKVNVRPKRHGHTQTAPYCATFGFTNLQMSKNIAKNISQNKDNKNIEHFNPNRRHPTGQIDEPNRTSKFFSYVNFQQYLVLIDKKIVWIDRKIDSNDRKLPLVTHFQYPLGFLWCSWKRFLIGLSCLVCMLRSKMFSIS